MEASVRPLREDFPQELSPQAERGETVRDVDQVRPGRVAGVTIAVRAVGPENVPETAPARNR